MTPRLLKIADAVAYSGESRSGLYLRIARGELRAVKSGRRTLIDRESLDRVLDALPSANIRIPSAA